MPLYTSASVRPSADTVAFTRAITFPFTFVTMSCCRGATVLMDIVAPSGTRPPTTGHYVPPGEAVYVRFSQGTPPPFACCPLWCGSQTPLENQSAILTEVYFGQIIRALGASPGRCR